MMIKTALLLASVVMTTPAIAQSCVPRDISAYRQDMKRPFDRVQVARQYCGMQSRRADMIGGTRQADACDAEMQKISDVMGQAKAYREYQYALAGCQGKFDDFKPKHWNPKTRQFE